jgi:hypothetical protein
MEVDERPVESALDPSKLLDPVDPTGLVPIALVNRVDLAPSDWSDCGEYRIIYSFKAAVPVNRVPPPPEGRFFLIFEGRLENASPKKLGIEGCRATANFWRDLTDQPDERKRADRLEEFYYKGSKGTAGPVVQAKNYGSPIGQVRGNLGVFAPAERFKWVLREWIIVNSGQPTPASFVSVTVKDNPLAELYSRGTPRTPLDPLTVFERSKFQEEFLNTSLGRLLSPDVIRKFLKPGQPGYKPELDPDPNNHLFNIERYKIEILNAFGARFQNRFNEFQSVANGPEDNPEEKAGVGSELRRNIESKLLQFVIDPLQKPSAREVLNRAGALTCGGCHEFTNFKSIGQVRGTPIKWPGSGGFVHIEEDGRLSKALTDVFLPYRKDRLGETVCTEVDFERAVQAPEGFEKPGYFVINRRTH